MTAFIYSSVYLCSGRIVNVTSVKGRICTPLNAAYHITKYGAEGFSDTLRQEMTQFGVKVIIVEPGNFGTETGILNEGNVSAN
jgi:3-hydroxybutyrate dehydrogenase